MKRSTLLVGSAAILSWVFFAVVGEWFIRVSVGPQFLDAYAIAIIYMLGSVIALLTFSFTPALLAIGLPVKSFLANLVATVFYFLALIPLLLALGVSGAALAYVVYYLVWTAVMFYLLLPYLKSPQPVSYDENEI
jgi:O-antigen/teichoic acid export membrane protein